MQYDIAQPGRIIVARLTDGEDLYQSLEGLAARENIRSAAVFITGGLAQADVVAGPKEIEPKIVGDLRHFQGPGDVLGVGTIYADDTGPKLHIHTAIGKGDRVLTGCPRGGAEVFLILEVTIIEFVGIEARRELDPQSGLKLLKLGKTYHG